MAFSSTYTFTVGRDEVIRQSMLDIGCLSEGEVPTASEISDCATRFDMMVKQFQARQDFAPGLKMWNRARGELYLSSTTGEYQVGTSATGFGSTHNQNTTSATALAASSTVVLSAATGVTSGDKVGVCLDDGSLFWTTATLSSLTLTLASPLPSQATAGAYVFNYTTNAMRPEIIETAVLRDVDFNDVPLNFLNLQDYELLPTKAATTNIADPQGIYYEYKLNSTDYGLLFTDCGAAADVTKHIHMVYLTPAMDIGIGTDIPFFPQSWFEALHWQLAKRIAPMFRRPWDANQESLAGMALAMAQEAFGEVSSMYFEPGREDRVRQT